MNDIIPGKKPQKDDKYFHHLDEDGKLHVVDIETGNIVKSAPQFEKGLVKGNVFEPDFIKGKGQFWHYSPLYRDLIAQKIAEGKTMTAICKEPGFPSSSTIAIWRAKNPDFEEAIQIARKARAEMYADRVADSLEETRDLSKDEVPAEKLYLDKLKWLAEKNDARTYGTRKEEGGSTATPVQMTINTGVPLNEEESPVTIEVVPNEPT